MQNIVGMLILDRTDLGAPISQLSPWLDMLIRTDAEVFAMLEAQTHRRWIKTHTPLDGVPFNPSVTYIAVVRHPLDVALSDRDHSANQDIERFRELRAAVVGEVAPELVATWPDPPEDASGTSAVVRRQRSPSERQRSQRPRRLLRSGLHVLGAPSRIERPPVPLSGPLGRPRRRDAARRAVCSTCRWTSAGGPSSSRLQRSTRCEHVLGRPRRKPICRSGTTPSSSSVSAAVATGRHCSARPTSTTSTIA